MLIRLKQTHPNLVYGLDQASPGNVWADDLLRNYAIARTRWRMDLDLSLFQERNNGTQLLGL